MLKIMSDLTADQLATLRIMIKKWRLANPQIKAPRVGLELFLLLITMAEREIALRNAVFHLCGHLPGVSDEEQLAAMKEEFKRLRILEGKVLQDRTNILTKQPKEKS